MNSNAPPTLSLPALARRTMLEHGFEPDVPRAALEEVPSRAAAGLVRAQSDDVQDLRDLWWSSIDNDTSRDLDQVEVVESLPGGRTRVLVAIADVDAYVPQGSAIDRYAEVETTTVYTGVRTFPMLPEALSTDLTSLLEAQDRLAIVIEFVVLPDGQQADERIYRARIRNRAQLTYDTVGAWLDGAAPPPLKVAASSNLQTQLRLQDEVAQRLRTERQRQGALNIETAEARPIIVGDHVVGLVEHARSRATDLIENFMVASNGVVARALESWPVSSIRRVVRTPERWSRIVSIAAGVGEVLPETPDPKALNSFLLRRQQADPTHFADLSLSVIKLLGPGEYALERVGEDIGGHFALAVDDYTHSTAPNRRYADLVTQRIVKAHLASAPPPYDDVRLAEIAKACTFKEDAARKVEREMGKRLAASAAVHRIGDAFDAVVTGVTPRGTFVRVLRPRLEGLLVHGADGRDVGDALRVRLLRADVDKGFIDFGAV